MKKRKGCEMKKLFYCLAMLAVLAAPVALAQEDSGAANANRVTLEMAQAAIKNQKDAADNLVISPYNALTNMALVGTGAKGATAEEFSKALFRASPDAFGEQAQKLMKLDGAILAASKGIVDILTANGVWVNQDRAELGADFEKTAQDVFRASISAEDFQAPETVDKINAWAGKHTKGLITKIIERLRQDDAIVLASALYFKGDWTWKFDKDLTEDRPFTMDGGKKAVTPTMRQEFAEKGRIRWREGDDYEAVAMTYGEKRPPYMGMGGTEPSMRLVLIRPKKAQDSARDWLLRQEPALVPNWLNPADYQDVTGIVELPHIDIAQKLDLIPALKDMGIKDAFGGGADFSGMAEAKGGRLYVSKVSHDVVFKTDEEGSEAAAVTTTTIGITSVIVDEPRRIEIKFDRSFVFALQDAATGTVLFMGAVNRPNGEMN